MNTESKDINRILDQLTQSPFRLEKLTRGIETVRLHLRSDAEPWSVSDILAHLRACSDVWGKAIMMMITQDNPTMRYVSPRSWMRKPKYRDQEFGAALETYTLERQKLVKTLTDVDEAGWGRRGTFTGTSARQRDQTVLSYANRIVNHEQPHLEQIETLLR